MAGRGVEIEVILFHVLAVVALIAGQTERPFLENRIAAVPQGERETQPLLLVADAAQTVLVPAIDAGAGLIVVEMFPSFAVGAVVLANRAPSPFREIRPPQPPVFLILVLSFQAQALGIVDGSRGFHGGFSRIGVASAGRSFVIDEPLRYFWANSLSENEIARSIKYSSLESATLMPLEKCQITY